MTPLDPFGVTDRSLPTGDARGLASWYSQGHSDGVGDRLLMFDNSGTPSLELLRFRPELVAAFGFEQALRERVERLKYFKHDMFPEIRAVETLQGTSDLALVSIFTPGKRLSEVVRTLRPSLHAPFAAWLLRELLPALDDLQKHGGGIGHGALTAERIVLSRERRLMIVEHALGPALDGLRWPPARLWQSLGVVSTPSVAGSSLTDSRADVVQLALIALAILVGRRISSFEYPERLDALLEEFARTTGSQSPGLVAPLRTWLEQALRGRGAIFRSPAEAHEALGDLGDHKPKLWLEFFPSRSFVFSSGPSRPVSRSPIRLPEADSSELTDTARVALASDPPVAENRDGQMVNKAASSGQNPVPKAIASEPDLRIRFEDSQGLDDFNPEGSSEPHPLENSIAIDSIKPAMHDDGGRALQAFSAPPPQPESLAPQSVSPPPVVATGAPRIVASPPPQPAPAPVFQKLTPEPRAVRLPTRAPRWRAAPVAVILTAVAVLEAIAIGGLLYTRTPATTAAPPAPAPASIPVTLESLQAGDTVLVNGQSAGVTPLTLSLGPEMRSIQIQSRAVPPAPQQAVTLPAPAPAPAVVPPAAAAIAQAAAKQRSGGLQVSSPIEIQVLEGDRVLGSSANGIVVASAGKRELEFINSALGYHTRQQVEIKPNEIVRVSIIPPPGRVSINVTPWAQVWIDGNPVGETPLANLPMAAGEHQITFRHPQLGERTEKFVVRPSALTRVSTTMGQ